MDLALSSPAKRQGHQRLGEQQKIWTNALRLLGPRKRDAEGISLAVRAGYSVAAAPGAPFMPLSELPQALPGCSQGNSSVAKGRHCCFTLTSGSQPVVHGRCLGMASAQCPAKLLQRTYIPLHLLG